MEATIKRMADIMGGRQQNTPMLQVTVVKADGSEKSYDIPKFKKEVIAQFQQYGPGDPVDITFKQNDKGFMNIVSVDKLAAPVQPKKRGSYGQNDAGKNKGVALSYVMRYVLPQTHTEAVLRKMGPEEYIEIATPLADRIVAYLEGQDSEETDSDVGMVRGSDSSTGIPTPSIS